MSEEGKAAEGTEGAVETGLEGTPFKSGSEAAKGYMNLKALHDAQANELGALRKFAETVAPIVQGHLDKSKAPAAEQGPDFDTEIATVNQQITKLDPMSDTYQKDLADLVAKSNNLVAKASAKTAQEILKKELSERDAKAARAEFEKINPTFKDPEMQGRIRDFLTADKTGMHDAMSAYFQIQRDDIAKEHDEMKKVLELTKGKEKTGTVVVKGQTTSPPAKPQKATGRDLDAGMAAVLAAQRGS